MLLGIAIMTAFIPGVTALASVTSWAVMWLIMPVLLLKCKIEFTIIHILGLVFLSYAALSLLWSPHGMLELMQMLALASVFVWGCTLKDLKSITTGLSIGLTISSIMAVFQYFDLDFVYSLGGKPSGLFINPNIYAEISGMLLILILINKLWWFIPVAVPGLLVSSRAVMIGLAAVSLIWIWNKSKLLAASLAACLVAVGAVLINYRTDTIYQRIYIWHDAISGFKLFGNGIGSFVYVFPNYNKHLDSQNLAENAHNDLIQLIFELGVGAIPLILIAIMLLKVDNDYKFALIFFIIVGFFGFPLHTPITVFMVALVAAQLVKFRYSSWKFSNSFRLLLSDRLATIKYS